MCLAVAVLLGCFSPPGDAAGCAATAPGSALAGSSALCFAGPWPCPELYAKQQQQHDAAGSGPRLPAEPVSKQSVRQRLALVSGCYPLARPTRAMLKQVFNYFEERRRAAAVQGHGSS